MTTTADESGYSGKIATPKPDVLAELDRIASMLCDLDYQKDRDSVRTIRTKLAALVEACETFDMEVNPLLDDMHPMSRRFSAREFRKLHAALRDLGR